jgi:2',3'-cyclic-nucleotide 2'-phosphodiesterase (5'-nucleotidase family)
MSQVAAELTAPVDAIFGGHNHALEDDVVNGIPVFEDSVNLTGYRLARFRVDLAAHQATFLDQRFVRVRWPDGDPAPVEPDGTIEGIVSSWSALLDDALAETIGYTATGISLGSWAQANWTCDAWLATFPNASVVIQNFGGLRQSIAAGDIRKLDVFGMMPFENRIYELELTGEQIRANIVQATASCGTVGACSPAIAGMRYQGVGDAVVLLQPDGHPLDLWASYRVLVNDFIYAGGGGYLFASQDPTPVDLGVNYRDPVIDWTAALATSASDPLEAHIDATPRSP